MNIIYISPSTIPSRTANCIHVLHQVSALDDGINKITFVFHRNTPKYKNLKKIILKNFNLDLKNIKFIILSSNIKWGINLFIALKAITHILFKKDFDLIISRNIYSAFILSNFLRKKVVYETHSLEFGIRKIIQYLTIKSSYTKTITISKKLSVYLEKHHKINIHKNLILHDSAPINKYVQNYDKNNKLLKKYPFLKKIKKTYICGYFGHLYKGRGIEIIVDLAYKNKNITFIVVGGTEELIKKFKSTNKQNNLIFIGYLTYSKSQEIMNYCDILLMPYQKKVFLENGITDTSKWMSPMKMFEYLACGKPIISSDLPVLREVLKNNINSILVESDNINEWDSAIKLLIINKELRSKLGRNAYIDFKFNYTWEIRAKKIIKFNEEK